MKTHTIYDHISNYLKAHSWAKERKMRKEALKAILLEKYNIDENSHSFSVDKLIDWGEDWTSYDRLFRKVQEENEDLRGNDYEDGKILSQAYQQKLGHESGYHELKKLTKIT